MKKVEIEQVSNGYKVKLGDKEYVYTSTEDFKMIDAIGKYITDFKTKTERS